MLIKDKINNIIIIGLGFYQLLIGIKSIAIVIILIIDILKDNNF